MIVSRLVPNLAAAMMIAGASGCAASKAFETHDIPEALRAPASQLLTAETHAKGVQVYQCRLAKDDPTRLEWVLIEPKAKLFDMRGNRIATHYAGPTWEASDGSKVVGEVVARAASPHPNSIPWLLLRAQSTTGNGQFSGIKSVQRLHTRGGTAPATGCGERTAGKEIRVSYEADYFFYVAAP